MDIGVVIVTYNRIDKLKTALDLYDRQTLLPKYIIVVNNASTDGTGEYLSDWKENESGYKKILITSKSNLGGSGGFYLGLEESLKQDADWVWVSDDDAYPELDAIEKAQKHIDGIDGGVSAICGTVLNFGKIDTAHRRRMTLKFFKVNIEFVNEDEYKKDCFEINNFSYVGGLINKKAMQEVGLPIKDYFIWCDDGEHCLRLCKVGKVICFPDIVVNHDVGVTDSSILTWRDYYGYRNRMDQYRRHYGKFVTFIYCTFYSIRARFRIILRKNPKGNRMILDALKDYKKGKLGVSDKYRPGTKI